MNYKNDLFIIAAVKD